MNEYIKLPETVELYGTHIPQLKAKLIVRTNEKAIYYRWDNVWEVFRIKISKESNVFGKIIPKHEKYPGNEDFGLTAWCFTDEESAYKRYNNI